ncbi:hypothetical protein CDAR_184471 [Caerostris darwini]|uniref:Uncharacterized protein n=1 Tax=Caerostris darwini TaxID=1538125 RepID=A0AAV4QWW1_9ARAC|nr:hypothetical protein CDAR_184471 [Caerostris darwini]
MTSSLEVPSTSQPTSPPVNMARAISYAPVTRREGGIAQHLNPLLHFTGGERFNYVEIFLVNSPLTHVDLKFTVLKNGILFPRTWFEISTELLEMVEEGKKCSHLLCQLKFETNVLCVG